MEKDKIQDVDVENDMTDNTTRTTVMETEEETTIQAVPENIAQEETTESPTYNFDDLPFICNRVTYNMSSLSYADIEGMGFYLEDDVLLQDIQSMNFTSYEIACRKDADWSMIYVRFKNYTGTIKKIRDSELFSVSFTSNSDYSNCEIMLENGIMLGSTIDEVIAIMGEEDKYYSMPDGSYLLIYMDNPENDYSNQIVLSFRDGILDEIELDNYQ